MFSPKPLPYDLLLSPIASCFSVLNDLNLQKRDRKIEGYFHGYICMIKGPLLFMVLILIVSVRCLIYDSDVAVLHLPVITRRFLSFLNYMHFVIGCILGENRQKIYFYESPVA